MKIVHDEDFRLFSLAVGHFLSIKDPYSFATILLRDYLKGNVLWGMWCLAMLNERIINPREEEPLKTTKSKRGFLVWMIDNSMGGRYAYRGIDFISSKTVEDYYKSFGIKTAIKTGFSKLDIARNLRDMADKMDGGK